MYHKPRVERYGTLRELTLVGLNRTPSDGIPLCGLVGDNLCGKPGDACPPELTGRSGGV